MPTPDVIQAIDLPTFGDAPAVPTHLADTWYAMISRGLPRFANMTALNTAYPSPTAGQAAIVNGVLYLYVGAAWQYVQGSPVASTSDIDSPVAGMTSRVGADEFYYTGSSWVALNKKTSYTPSLTNITVGSGALTSYWTLLPGLRMRIEGKVDWGGGSGSLTGTLGWGLPSGWNIDPTSTFGADYGGATARPSAATGSNIHKGRCYNNGNATRVGMISIDGQGNIWNASTPDSTIASSPNGYISVNFEVPVVPA